MDSYVDLLNLNFMYSLRTGNLLTDMMIAALLPLVSGAVAYFTRTWWPQLVNRLLIYFSKVDCTSASFRTSVDSASIYYGFTLRVALSTYVTKVLQPRFDAAELKYLMIPGKNMHEAASYAEALRDFCFVDAGPAKEVPMELTRDLKLKQSDAGEENDDGRKKNGPGDAKNKKITRDTLFSLVQYHRRFPALQKLPWAHEAPEVRGETAQAVAELEERTKANGDAIQLVLDRALAHYRQEYKQARVTTDRYLYQPLLTRPKLVSCLGNADEKSGNEGAMDCNRYLLRSEKTFNSLFFPDKPRLLQLIDSFENKTGKYAIPGYPQKLVLLLYGPPGTGKTSLAKAVAAYTQRDLFAISLSRIRSNEELLKYMFSSQVRVKNGKSDDSNDCDPPKKLDPTRLVYILEDVDATSAVVLKDDEDTEQTEEGRISSVNGSSEKSGTSGGKKPLKKLPSGDSGRTVVESENEEGGEEERDGEGADNDKDVASLVDKSDKDNHKTATESTNAEMENNSTEREVVAVKNTSAKRARTLTIEGLANALNGVLDFPQRIVIMTTNHIEKLHPSLLRPGVVTMKLHMHNFDADCAVDMVKHYFSHIEIRPGQLEELRALAEKAPTKASKRDTIVSTSEDSAADSSTNDATETKRFSPAELEQRCAECETIDELLEVMRQGSRVNTF